MVAGVGLFCGIAFFLYLNTYHQLSPALSLFGVMLCAAGYFIFYHNGTIKHFDVIGSVELDGRSIKFEKEVEQTVELTLDYSSAIIILYHSYASKMMMRTGTRSFGENNHFILRHKNKEVFRTHFMIWNKEQALRLATLITQWKDHGIRVRVSGMKFPRS